MNTHTFSRLAAAAALLAVLVGSGCDVQLHDGYRVLLYNAGRDPIHVGSTRCPQNESTVIGFVGGEYEPEISFRLSREDINLGTLTLAQNRRATAKNDVEVTMTEPVYFDFRFESNDTARVRVSYQPP